MSFRVEFLAMFVLSLSLVRADAVFAQGGGRFTNEDKGPSVTTEIAEPFGELVLIPGSRFMMGSSKAEVERTWNECVSKFPKCDKRIFEPETPEHMVWVDSFYIDRYNITNRQYLECVQDRECTRPKRTLFLEDPQFADFPVVFVDWHQAYNYCSWAGGRLPTEAEWELAARGTDEFRFPWGYEFDEKRAVWNAKQPQPVGGRKSGASTFGIQDMAGNVWDWVQDWFDPRYYQRSPYANPRGPDNGRHRVFRGGSWSSDSPVYLRSTIRNHNRPSRWSPFIGIRCAKDVED